MFSKQLKNLQSNQLIGGFISIIYSSFAWGLRAEGPKAPEARPERAEAARPEDPEVPRSSTPCFAPHALKGQKLSNTWQHTKLLPLLLYLHLEK